ncbi:MAG: FIST C-terminal domain-containing protein [Pseudomonadota bacterium]
MYVDSSTVDGLVEALAAVPRAADEHLMVLASHGVPDGLSALAKALHARNVPAFGAAFPGLFADNAFYETGAIGLPVALRAAPRIVEDSRSAWALLPESASVDQSDSKHTALLFYCSPNYEVSELITQVYDRWGPMASYLGGGAGSAFYRGGPSVFAGPDTTNRGAVFAIATMRTTLDVAHGWEPVAGPLLASRCSRNVIHELNWRPAVDMYRNTLPGSLEIGDEQDLITRVFPQFPFAVGESDSDLCVVRSPLGIDDNGGLELACGVSENTTLYIAQATPEKLREATDNLTVLAPTEETIGYSLMISCVSRQNYLGQSRFVDELQSVGQQAGGPVYGLASLGAIASTGERYFETHSKALAMARIHA